MPIGDDALDPLDSEVPESTDVVPRVRRVIAVMGSRGGVGSSIVAVNLAVYLAQLGRTVALVDADPSGAFVHSMLGVSTPAAPLDEENEDELHLMKTLVPGLLLEPQRYSVGSSQPARPGRKPRWAKRLRTLDADHVLLDLGVSTSAASLELFLGADLGLCVTTPEPPSVEGVYRLLRALFQRSLRRSLVRDPYNMRVVERVLASLPPLPDPPRVVQALREYDSSLGDLGAIELAKLRPRLVVNSVRLRTDNDLGPAMVDLSQRYLGVALDYVGHIEHDDAVWLSVVRQRPLLIDSPASKSARNLERIARRVQALANARELGRTPPPEAPIGGEPSLYEMLMTHPGAGDEELRKAYKRQCEIYKAGSLPLSALLSDAERLSEQARIEEAHDTLLDPRRRRAYDLSSFPERQEQKAQPKAEDSALLAERAMLREELAHELNAETQFSGALLRKVRESQGIELDDIALITKINRAQLRAVEEEAFAELPPSVYLKGFIQELARCLKLDPTQVARTYLRRYAAWRADGNSRTGS
jgi:flagellar biosynthesis protein FlhG